jgi:hypothetical protein
VTQLITPSARWRSLASPAVLSTSKVFRAERENRQGASRRQAADMAFTGEPGGSLHLKSLPRRKRKPPGRQPTPSRRPLENGDPTHHPICSLAFTGEPGGSLHLKSRPRRKRKPPGRQPQTWHSLASLAVLSTSKAVRAERENRQGASRRQAADLWRMRIQLITVSAHWRTWRFSPTSKAVRAERERTG